MDTDASDFGIGAVLSQCQEDGKEHVINYASWLLHHMKRVISSRYIPSSLPSVSDWRTICDSDWPWCIDMVTKLQVTWKATCKVAGEVVRISIHYCSPTRSEAQQRWCSLTFTMPTAWKASRGHHCKHIITNCIRRILVGWTTADAAGWQMPRRTVAG